jgi:hypothetical protein
MPTGENKLTLTDTVTLALINADGAAHPDMPDSVYDDYELRARYVVEAIRDFIPTERMVDYGYTEVTNKINEDGRDLPHVWKAMMIAAQQDAE